MTLSIDDRAARWGDRTAVIDVSEGDRFAPAGTIADDRLSYAGLAALSRRTAAALTAESVGAGDAVALVSRNRVATLALLFACRRLGATLAPISHRLTPATVERPLARVEPTVVLHERGQRDLVRAVETDRTIALPDLELDRDETDSGAGSDDDRVSIGATAPLLALHSDDGTAIATFSDAAVEWNCITATTTWGLGRYDRTVLLRPLSSPDGLLQVALPVLYTGGRLAIDRAFDPADAATAIRAVDATFLVGQPTEFRELLAHTSDASTLDTVDWASIHGQANGDVVATLGRHGTTVSRGFSCLACPNALGTSIDESIELPAGTDSERADDTPAGESSDGGYVGRPLLDVAARLVADGRVVSGTGSGWLELSGPGVATDLRADGTHVGAADTADSPETDRETRDVPARDRWIRTGHRFRRDRRGYTMLDGANEPDAPNDR